MPGAVTLVVVEGTDERVVGEARELLADLGATEVQEADPDDVPDADFVLALADGVTPEATAVLAALDATPPPDDVAESYTTAVGTVAGTDAAVVVGNDARCDIGA